MKSFQRHRILVVDDSKDNLFLLQSALEEEGYDVETALSGSSALSKIKASPPNLLLLDVMMPGINGLEVTQSIRQNNKLPFIPIVFVTACEESDILEGLGMGANDFIRKPINLDRLLEKIKVQLQITSKLNVY